MKRVLSFLLSIIMVMSCVVVVSAEETNVIELDKTYTVTFGEDYNSETFFYSFTPSETSYYVIKSVSAKDKNGDGPDPYVTVRDADGNKLAHNDDFGAGLDFAVLCYFEKDNMYTIEVKSFGAGVFDFGIEKGLLSEDFSIEGFKKVTFTVGTDYEFVVNANDGISIIDGNWSVSDDEIANVKFTSDIDLNSGWCVVFFEQTGTFTLTFTSKNGISESIDVTVVEPEVLELDRKFNCKLLSGQQRILKFVPEESGYYTFYSKGDYDVEAELYIYNNLEDSIFSDNNSGEGANFKIIEYLGEGQEYFIKLSQNTEFNYISTVVFVEKANEPASIDISDADGLVVQVDQYFQIDAFLSPENVNCIVDWTVDNENVLSLDSNNYDNDIAKAEFCSKNEGSVTITATTVNGISSSATIKVVSPFVLEEDMPYTAKLSNHEYEYKFTPDSDGVYKFYSLDGYAVQASVYDGDGFSMKDVYAIRGNNLVVECYLKANKTYTLYFEIENRGCNEATVCVSKEEGTANRININLDDEVTYSVGSYAYVGFQTYPVKAAFNEDYTWHSTNENVAYMDGEVLYLVSEGSATITVETESGLTDSIEVNVIATPELFANQKNNIKSICDELLRYSFVPKISGKYVIFSNSKETLDYYIQDPAMIMYDSELERIAYSDDDINLRDFYAEVELVAGETYYIDYFIFALYTETEVCIQYVDNELGDITGDGSVNQLDTTILRRSLVGLVPNIMTNVADINEDGAVNQLDVTLLRRSLVA